MIATQHERYRTFGAVNNQRLQCLLRGYFERFTQGLNGLDIRCCDLLEFLFRRGTFAWWRHGRSGLEVRGIIVGVAVSDGIFAGFGENMKFL